MIQSAIFTSAIEFHVWKSSTEFDSYFWGMSEGDGLHGAGV